MQEGSLADLDLVGVLWRRKLSLVLSVLLGAGLGYGLSQLQPVRYTAESRVFLSSAAAFDPLGQRSGGNQERYVVQQAELMTSQPVLDRVTPPPGMERDELMDAIAVNASGDSDLVLVSATAGTPVGAAALADEVAVAYQEYNAERVEEAAARAVAAVSDPDQAEQIRAAAAVYDDGVALVDRAVVPGSPSHPAPLRNAVLLGVLAGLVFAAIAVLSHGRRSAASRRRSAEVTREPASSPWTHERAADHQEAAGPARPVRGPGSSVPDVPTSGSGSEPPRGVETRPRGADGEAPPVARSVLVESPPRPAQRGTERDS